jgi:hypothetical protein
MTQQVDAVYPLYRAGLEIRYSVRGLLLHATNIGRIFIIGDRPKFFEGTKFTHIPFKDVNNRPYENVWRKLETVARDERISEKLLWMNDDFYITQPFDATAVPNYCRAMDLFEMTVLDKPLANLSPYKKTLKRTRDALAKHGMPGTHFGTHQPVNFEKQKILATVAEFEEDISNGISFRCCYQNMHKAPQTVRSTVVVKHVDRVPNKWAFASKGTADMAVLERGLSRLYPEKSMLEA